MKKKMTYKQVLNQARKGVVDSAKLYNQSVKTYNQVVQDGVRKGYVRPAGTTLV